MRTRLLLAGANIVLSVRSASLSLAFLLFLLTINSHAQIYDFKSYTIREGLLSNAITSLCQDSHGYLWVGTGDGLSVYDGEKFRNYTVADGLASSLVNCIIEDVSRKGEMWIGTNGAGIDRYASGSFTKIRLPGSDWSNRINSIAQDRFGWLYCGTDDGIFRIGNGTAAPISNQFEHGSFGAVVCVNDSLFVVDLKGGLFRFNLSGGAIAARAERIPTRFRVAKIYLDPKEELWIASYHGDLENMSNHRFIHHVFKSVPTFLTDDILGDVWVGTFEGLYRIDSNPSRRKSITHVTEANGLSKNHLTAGFVDREGDLWVGTYDRGLAKLSDKNTLKFPLNYEYMSPNNSQATSDKDGRIWVACRDGLMMIRGDGYGVLNTRFYAYRTMGISSNCNIVRIESGDRLWLATDDGLILCYQILTSDDGTPSLVHVKSFTVNRIMPGLTPLCLYIDDSGNAWYSRDQAGVLEFNTERGLEGARILTTKDGLPDNSIRAIAEDKEGDLWFGGYIGGLAELKNRGNARTAKLYTVKDGLPDNSVRAIVEDDSGRIWVGTRYDGVAVLKAGVFRAITVKQGLVSDGVWGASYDGKRGVLFGTESGLQELEGGAIDSCKWQSFGELTPVFSCGVTAPTPPSRMHEFLWGCTGSGIILTDLSRIRHVRVPPSVYITGVLANGSEVDINSPLRLKYNMNTVTFHFAGISLRDEGSLKYRYILHGADERWTSVSGRLPVTYVSLRPGYYTFEVKAVSPAGIESKSVASLAFAIIPPIWQRWWFLLISGITLAYVVYYSIRLRVRRLLEIERVRGRIATDLHDEIGSGLTRIAILADVALRQTESPEAVSPEANALQMQDNKESFSTHNLVHKIGVNARDLVDSMSDVVWSIDPKNATVADLVTRFRSFAYEMCEAKGINLQFATDSDLKSLPLDPVIMRALLIITKEALNNSVKHSGCKNLSIGIKSIKNQISLLISDDGRGFPVESHSSGHGLGNMRARAEKLGGEYKLKSSPGDGTTIQVTVPANA